MRKKLLHNWGLKLASLVLAFVLWFLVVQIDDPKDSRSFSNIPVTLKNTELLDKENKVYEVLDNSDTVRVVVTAPRSVFENLRASDIVAEADMSKLTDINTIAITYSVLNADVTSIRGDHDAVRLNVEEKSTKWVKVQYNIVGEVADGYMVAGASPDQTLIEVTGPKSAVEQISYAGVEIDVTGATSNLSANVESQLYNENGERLDFSSVTKNVNYIHMAVEVLATKEIPIELSTMGAPAEGYLATGVIECTPNTVKIAGTPNALSSISRIAVPEEELDITGQTENLVSTINIKEYLPDNIRLADSRFNGRVTVTVYVEPEAERTLEIPAEEIAIVNVPTGLQAELTDEKEVYEVKLHGLEAVLAAVDSGAVRGVIDIAAWMEQEDLQELSPGSHLIPISFEISDDIIMEEELTARVTFSKVEE